MGARSWHMPSRRWGWWFRDVVKSFDWPQPARCFFFFFLPQRPYWYDLTKLPSCLPSLTGVISGENNCWMLRFWGKSLFVRKAAVAPQCAHLHHVSSQQYRSVIIWLYARLWEIFHVLQRFEACDQQTLVWSLYNDGEELHHPLSHVLRFFMQILRALPRLTRNNRLRAQTVITCTNGPFNLCSVCWCCVAEKVPQSHRYLLVA